jgi:hypothetical protein
VDVKGTAREAVQGYLDGWYRPAKNLNVGKPPVIVHMGNSKRGL